MIRYLAILLLLTGCATKRSVKPSAVSDQLAQPLPPLPQVHVIPVHWHNAIGVEASTDLVTWQEVPFVVVGEDWEVQGNGEPMKFYRGKYK